MPIRWEDEPQTTGQKSRVGRPLYRDPSGGVYSEKTVTFPIGADWYTFPSVDASGNIKSEDEVADYVRRNGAVDPITGERFPSFKSQQEAELYARQRSDGLLAQPRKRRIVWEDAVVAADPANQARIEQAFSVPEAVAQPNVTEDVLKSAGSGFARGVADVVGIPGTISDAAESGLNWLLKKGFGAVTGRDPQFSAGGLERFFADAPPEIAAKMENPLSGGKMRSYLSGASGGATDYQPKTTPGEYARTFGEFAPGVMAYGGASLPNLARYGALPAIASETAGQMTKGTEYEPYARFGAAVTAPFAVGGAARLATPYRASGGAERADMVKFLEAEGVPFTAGQRIGNKALQYKEAKATGAGIAEITEQQGRAFTAAVMRRIGVNSDVATPQVIQQAADDIGQRFNVLTANNAIGSDARMVRELIDVRRRYMRDVPTMARTGTLDSALNDVANSLKQTNGVPGQVYQNLRSEIARAARSATANNPQTDRALRDFVNVLDDAMERSIAKSNPNMLGEWKEARRLYRNFLTIERAATGAGENAALGIISPASLKNAAMQVQGRRAYARGKGEFAKLARAGEATMKPLPQSGTAPRLQALLSSLPTIIGGTAGATQGAEMAMAGAMAGAVLPRMLGAAAMSRPGQAYLGNQMMAGTPFVTNADLPLAALRADQSRIRRP